MIDEEEKDRAPMRHEREDSWWYRVYAAALIFTAVFIVLLQIFERAFSK